MQERLTELIITLRRAGMRYAEALAIFEKQYVLEILCRHHWHYGKTSAALRIHRNTLTRRLRQLGIARRDKDMLQREWLSRRWRIAVHTVKPVESAI